MTARERLPARRKSETQLIRYGDRTYFVTVGHYPDGRPGEVFVDTAKAGTFIQNVMRDGAVAISLALQHGTDVATLRDACLREADGSPASPLGAVFDMIAAARP